MEFSDNFYFAFLLTCFAGLSTGIGSAIAFFSNKTNKSFLSATLGFSAGVMIYVAFVEIFAKSREALTHSFGDELGFWYATMSFFAGMFIILIIDRIIPSSENPHEPHKLEERQSLKEDEEVDILKLKRMGTFAAVAIAIHNFPEGLATFMAGLSDPALGVSIAIAIAIHNIPEGIAVSVPIYFSTGSRKKAFWYSFASGLSEPIGALIGYFLLRELFSETTFGLLFGAVGGIMVFISLDELIPTAKRYDLGHKAIYGIVMGMVVMALSLLLFI